MAKQTAFQFFLAHAGYSYDPKTETRMQGRFRSARELAGDEARALGAGASFEWHVDDLDSSEWSDEDPPYEQWVCIARDRNGVCFASLSGIDFGRNGSPWSSPYRRVVEAELAGELPQEDK